MGLLDLFRPSRAESNKGESAQDESAKPALRVVREAGANPADTNAVTRFVQRVLAVGLDGRGPVASASELGWRMRSHAGSDEKAISQISRQTVIRGGVGGFLTGIGGFLTMPVAIPVNVLEFYVQAARMVGAIAAVRGYDVSDPRIRTAVLLTLVGSRADDVLKSAGISTAGGRLAGLAMKRLPPDALMVANKAIGVRLLRSVGQRVFSRFGRAVPVVGGVIGGVLDAWMMKRIADHARREFPPRHARS